MSQDDTKPKGNTDTVKILMLVMFAVILALAAIQQLQYDSINKLNMQLQNNTKEISLLRNVTINQLNFDQDVRIWANQITENMTSLNHQIKK